VENDICFESYITSESSALRHCLEIRVGGKHNNLQNAMRNTVHGLQKCNHAKSLGSTSADGMHWLRVISLPSDDVHTDFAQSTRQDIWTPDCHYGAPCPTHETTEGLFCGPARSKFIRKF
jgi:hypothetical protein